MNFPQNQTVDNSEQQQVNGKNNPIDGYTLWN